MKDLRIAVAIMNSPISETQANRDKMTGLIESASKQGAELICFPELNITGYTSREDIIQYAEPVPGPSTRLLIQTAKTENMVILAGMAEKDTKNRIYASHIIAKPDGTMGVYRKLHIAPPEKKIFTPGNTIPLFQIHDIHFGIQLCYDAHFPDLSTYMAAKGAHIIFFSHASPRGTSGQKFDSWMRHLPARAYDNSLFVIACNQTGDNKNGLVFPGVSMIISPSGEVLDSDTSGKEGLLIADLKAKDLNTVRNHKMRYFFPNRRPELYE